MTMQGVPLLVLAALASAPQSHAWTVFTQAINSGATAACLSALKADVACPADISSMATLVSHRGWDYDMNDAGIDFFNEATNSWDVPSDFIEAFGIVPDFPDLNGVDYPQFCDPNQACQTSLRQYVANVASACPAGQVFGGLSVADHIANIQASARIPCLTDNVGSCMDYFQAINPGTVFSRTDLADNILAGMVDPSTYCSPCLLQYFYELGSTSQVDYYQNYQDVSNLQKANCNSAAIASASEASTTPSRRDTGAVTVGNPWQSIISQYDAQCGPQSLGNYTCPGAQCCNQYGQCGNTATHCGPPLVNVPGSGCLIGFGQCTRPVNPQATCGDFSAHLSACASGSCCSAAGTCGTDAASCAGANLTAPVTAPFMTQGCQPGYGTCNRFVDPKAVCGSMSQANATCPAGQCCDVHGQCSIDNCFLDATLCLPDYGPCGAGFDSSAVCGATSQNATSCEAFTCCSASGQCGTDAATCGSGCQNTFGVCGFPVPQACPAVNSTTYQLPQTAAGTNGVSPCGPGKALTTAQFSAFFTHLTWQPLYPVGFTGTKTIPCRSYGYWSYLNEDASQCVLATPPAIFVPPFTPNPIVWGPLGLGNVTVTLPTSNVTTVNGNVPPYTSSSFVLVSNAGSQPGQAVIPNTIFPSNVHAGDGTDIRNNLAKQWQWASYVAGTPSTYILSVAFPIIGCLTASPAANAPVANAGCGKGLLTQQWHIMTTGAVQNFATRTCLQFGADGQLYLTACTTAPTWTFQPVFLAASPNSTMPSTNTSTPVGSGYVSIVNPGNQKCIDVPAAGSSTTVDISTCVGGKVGQEWFYDATSGLIHSGQNTTQCLGVNALTAQQPVLLRPCTATDQGNVWSVNGTVVTLRGAPLVLFDFGDSNVDGHALMVYVAAVAKASAGAQWVFGPASNSTASAAVSARLPPARPDVAAIPHEAVAAAARKNPGTPPANGNANNGTLPRETVAAQASDRASATLKTVATHVTRH
ncbi:hypothetical protein HKX48_006341 [Thoreauomyces humboldtii]|nr:hypothetical protein HKX48_006341 [Thoreauomyces humboldtii]